MPTLSVRLSDDDMAWVQSQGRASDVCRRIISESRGNDGISPATLAQFRLVLLAIRKVDKRANEILEHLPRNGQ
jgi:hypothetical protein